MTRDFFDGELASKYPTRFGNNIVPMLLYFDDLEVANPLGSKRQQAQTTSQNVVCVLHTVELAYKIQV